MSHRLPSLNTLVDMRPADAKAILNAHERDLRQYYPDDTCVRYDYRGRAYYRGLTARKLKRIARFRTALGL